ncbi:VacJ family lipoprotein, partial [bacterium]|nr:VacJ family lipoprotein [bacterium]
NQMDRYLLEPVADGYDAVVPDPMQRGVRNVFENLAYPRYLVSDLVQLKFGQAAEHTGRFLVNSTLGLGGLIDVAKHLGWERHSEDFGTALGHHGVPTGPYVVIPFLGPSNMRDGFSRIVDNFLSPVPWIAAETSSDNDAVAITLGMTALDVIQTRADLDEAINAAQEASLDYYLFIQSAYAQRRFAVIHDLQIEDSPTALENEADPFAEDEAFDEAFAGEGGYGLGNE